MTTATDRPRISGPHLRRLRYCRGWTLADAAAHVQHHAQQAVHASTLAKIEKGQRNASPPLAFALAVAFGVTVDELLATGA